MSDASSRSIIEHHPANRTTAPVTEVQAPASRWQRHDVISRNAIALGILRLLHGNVRNTDIVKACGQDILLTLLRDPAVRRPSLDAANHWLCSGSRARAYVGAGTPFAEDPLCTYDSRAGRAGAGSGRSAGGAGRAAIAKIGERGPLLIRRLSNTRRNAIEIGAHDRLLGIGAEALYQPAVQ